MEVSPRRIPEKIHWEIHSIEEDRSLEESLKKFSGEIVECLLKDFLAESLLKLWEKFLG